MKDSIDRISKHVPKAAEHSKVEKIKRYMLKCERRVGHTSHLNGARRVGVSGQ